MIIHSPGDLEAEQRHCIMRQLSSPSLTPNVAEEAPIAEYASFLPMMDSFMLADEHVPGWISPNSVVSQPRSRELEDLVQSAFTEMDQALGQQRVLAGGPMSSLPMSVPSECSPHHVEAAMSWASSEGFGARGAVSAGLGERPSVAPTEEEQEWLDEQMAELDEHMWDEPFVVRDRSEHSDESEEDFVAQMLCMHPNLNEDEVRWLFARQRAHYSPSPPSSSEPIVVDTLGFGVAA